MSKRGTCCLLVLVSTIASPLAADDGTGNETCEFDPHELPLCEYEPEVLLPDLMTVVPTHLGIQNEHQREMLRFSNGIANLGLGPWWLEPEFPDVASGQSCQAAIQVITGPEHFVGRQIIPTDEEVPAPPGTHARKCPKGNFDFHETHNHWHIDNVGEFKVCAEADFERDATLCEPARTGSGEPTVGIKFTFCLIDWYKLGDNGPSSDDTRNFFACETGFQGVSPGWVDQYHHATPGQEVDITGLPAGAYVLVSTVNGGTLEGHPVFEEEDTANNASWTRFALARTSKGNAKIVDERGACEEPVYHAALAGEVAQFVAAYHPSDEAFAAAVLDDMCGGKSTNK